jgi:LAO/AO transport system kinase
MLVQKPPAIDLIDYALRLEKYPLAKLISVFEREDPKSLLERQSILAELNNRKVSRKGFVVGWTGSPGAGKSTLLAALTQRLLDSYADNSVAILAIDPSSHVSGGSLLGDRTRTRFAPAETRVFFRSQASDLELGGLGRATYPVCNLLTYFFDIIFIETVGVGQSEIEIRKLADITALVLQPFAGDQIQFIKSGIMEIPHLFIISKCDEEKLAKKSYHQLQASLEFMSSLSELHEADITLTSAVTDKGITELAQKIYRLRQTAATRFSGLASGRDFYFLQKAAQRAYGEFGLSVLKKTYDANQEYEKNLSRFLSHIKTCIKEDLL